MKQFFCIIDTKKFNPRLPVRLKFPGEPFCADPTKTLLIAGKIESGSEKVAEIVMKGHGAEEGFHYSLDVGNKVIWHWVQLEGKEQQKIEIQGEETSINVGELFEIR